MEDQSNLWFTKYSTTINSLDLQLQICRTEQNKLKNDFLRFVSKSKGFLNLLKDDISSLRSLEPSSESVLNLHETLPHECVPKFRDAGEVEKYINRVKKNYDQALQIMSCDLTEVGNQHLILRKKSEEQESQISVFKTQIQKYKETIEKNGKQSTKSSLDLKKAKDSMVVMEMKLLEQQEELDSVQKENISLKSHNDDLSVTITDLTEKLTQLELEKKSFGKLAKKTLIEGQEALLQKKASAYKEQRAMDFVEDLRKSLKKEIELAVSLQKREMTDVQKQSSAKIARLTEELDSLQAENADKQSLFERAVREKNALESKLKTVTSKEKTRVPISVLEKLYRDVFQLEKQRDAANNEARSLNNSLRALQKSQTNEAEFFQLETRKLQVELFASKEKIDEILKDKEILVDQMAELKKKIRPMQERIETMELLHKKELLGWKTASQERIEALQLQLGISEQNNKKNFQQFQELLKVQQQVCEKWKRALQECATKSELKIKELHQDLHQVRKQNETLNNLLHNQNSSLNVL